MPEISVIICTHNPRPDFFRRTLDGLKSQTLSREQWEFLLIDNASKEILAPAWDLSWHPMGRHIREEQLGLTVARLRGIRESNAELIVFVDDDNVLFPDYLALCSRLARDWPLLGAWGGQHFPEFEGGPPAEKWKADFWTNTLSRDLWSNFYDLQAAPSGAGVCVRKKVALKYAELTNSDPLRQRLGRKGSKLNGGEDFDMVFVACDLGMGLGRFVSLKLHHLMPTKRTDDDYLLRLYEGYAYSQVVLDSLRGIKAPPTRRIDRTASFLKRLFLQPMERKMAVAWENGIIRAINELEGISPPQK
ncbi:MAG TPA: glycosyltransferase [Verrucomicrobiae bacterium]|jgi:glycosyltransferase involved in cell wall biosynthesis